MKAAALFVSAAVYGGMSTPALAADLGGDCCADLEERVAELEATAVKKGNRKVSLTVYGQVTTQLMYWDNGERSDAYIVDNAIQSSRFGLQGSAKINPSLSAGFMIEVSTISAPSSNVTETDDEGGASEAGDGVVAVRQANWYLSHKSLGKLTVGRLEMATTGISEIDLGGIDVVTRPGIYFGNDIAVGGLGGTNFDVFALGNFEFDRNNAVRYDSPTFGGFVASASWGEDDRWDVTLRYAGELSGFRLAAGIGYGVGTDVGSGDATAVFDERRIFLGSASVLHSSTGLFLSGAFAQRVSELVAGGDQADFYWSARGGIAKNWFGIGKTVLYGEYHSWDNETADRDAEIWGAGVVQNLDAAAMELFLAYKNHSVSGGGTDDTHLVISGARIRF
jgi:predicted porin